LDLTEAVEGYPIKEANCSTGKLKAHGDGWDAYSETLNGGTEGQDMTYFIANSTGQCVRCHCRWVQWILRRPCMGQIGNLLSRNKILEGVD